MKDQQPLDSCFICQNKSQCFTKLKNSELEKSDRNKVQVNFKKGETIIKQGSFANHVFFVKKGLVKLYIETPFSQQNMVINLLPKGEIIGLPSIYEGNVYAYTAVAIEDVTICMIDNRLFQELIESNGKFAAELIKSINRCTRSLFDRFVGLTQKQLGARIADSLLYLAQEIYHSNKFQLTLSYADLAELTAMSKTSAVKIMKELREQKVISKEGSTYEILDTAALNRMSQGF